MNEIRINYSRIPNINLVLIVSSISVLLISVLVYLNPSNLGWWDNPNFSWFNILQFIFLDQIIIECISVLITISLLKIYAEKLKLTKVIMIRSGILKYQLYFLPVPIFAFFLFNPVTQTVRFLYHYWPKLAWEIYWEEYFYSLRLYIIYLPITFLQVYSVLNYNLLSLNSRNRKGLGSSLIEVNTPNGKKLLDKKDIVYCIKKGRKYYVHTVSQTFTTNMTILSLERLLSPYHFVRINRATIVKIDAIDSYSYWENEKYIVRISGNIEFTMSRNRLNEIKSSLSSNYDS